MTSSNHLKPKNNKDSYQFIIDTLTNWGITLYTGVTGGGVIHLLKYLPPFNEAIPGNPAFMTLGEYPSGFVPLGYYLGSGRIAAVVATTGAATKLISCGLSDAKLHDIPAVYIVPVSGKSTVGFSPLQDTTEYGSNIVMQLRAELPDAVFLLDSPVTLAERLSLAKTQLDSSKPVVLVLENEGLTEYHKQISPLPSVAPSVQRPDVDAFISAFRKAVNGKRVVILVGEEMARYPEARTLTTGICAQLGAAVVWSINGANAISRDNPYGYGYFSFGGNDKALKLYSSLGENDVVLLIGTCPDEYTANFNKFSVSDTFFLGNIPAAYGLVDNSLQHTVEGKYHGIHAPLDLLLQKFINAAKQLPYTNLRSETAPTDLNDRPFEPAGSGFVNMADLYRRLDQWWPADSIGIDDVCLAYKDRQYVTQRPNNNIRFYSLYRGSAMGGAFGVAVGAKLSRPEHPVFLFTGDGCFRLFSGSLGEATHLGLVIFLLNNESLAIVEQGLRIVIPDVPATRYHSRLNAIDYCGIASACGWDTAQLSPDLSNLDNLLDHIKSNSSRSQLIEVPCDPQQLLGSNPRLINL